VGESKSSAELAAKLTLTATALGRANRKAVGEAANTYKFGALQAAREDVGPDLRLSRWGAKRGRSTQGLKLGAGYDVRGYDNAVALLRARPQGVWKVVEYGAKPHPIVPGVSKRQTRFAASLANLTGETVNASTIVAGRKGKKRRMALKLPDGNIRFGVNHPGSRGKRTWSRGINKATPGALRTFRAVHARTLLDIFT
jgi:hypothetical protein